MFKSFHPLSGSVIAHELILADIAVTQAGLYIRLRLAVRVCLGCRVISVHMKAISDGLRRELEAIASAKGIDISKAAASSGHGSAVPPSARYSTLQDLDAGRHTEIDMFSGALVRMGRELGIPTPYNEYTYHMIKALEEKNDGKFDYSKEDGEVTCSR